MLYARNLCLVACTTSIRWRQLSRERQWIPLKSREVDFCGAQCDFFIAVTATFRMLYVFVVIEHGSRRLKHVAVTAHPSANWTLC